jgi:hypothetical protein
MGKTHGGWGTKYPKMWGWSQLLACPRPLLVLEMPLPISRLYPTLKRMGSCKRKVIKCSCQLAEELKKLMRNQNKKKAS